MCGILGFVRVPGEGLPAQPAFERALDTIAQRGPDDAGTWHDAHAMLGHRRLAIVDLSPAGHQPMHSADGRYTIVFNGEVYNFGALRKELLDAGVPLRSHTDTEVILELYAREGVDCLRRFRGMFALAIWDNQARELFLVRDRLGIKPLYYCRRGEVLAFASELKALRALPGFAGELDPQAIYAFLAWGHVPNAFTMVRDIASMAPGSWMRFGARGLEQGTYWSIPGALAPYRSRDEVVEALRSTLLEAVSLRCIADVPIGAFLSGGIDSSAIVALMRAANQRDIRTFSVTFPDTELDETPFAAEVARRFETQHTAAPATESMVRDILPRFFAALDQPTCDGLNTYIVSKLAKDAGLTVALSGLGGDEVFAGYGTFQRAERVEELLGRVLPPARALAGRFAARLHPRLSKLEAFGLPAPIAAQSYVASRGLFAAREIASILKPALSERAREQALIPLAPDAVSSFHSTMQLELRRYMHDQLLRDSDVLGMAHALEIRVPLIDHKVVELVARTPASWVTQGQHKQLLRDALPTPLPDSIVHRQKMGFTFPFAIWIRTAWRPLVEELLLAPSPWFESRGVSRIWQGFLAGEVHWSRPWSLYVLKRWLAEHGSISGAP